MNKNKTPHLDAVQGAARPMARLHAPAWACPFIVI
jgi:hypothetical protein